MMQVIPHAFETFGRRFADLLLFCVTSTLVARACGLARSRAGFSGARSWS